MACPLPLICPKPSCAFASSASHAELVLADVPAFSALPRKVWKTLGILERILRSFDGMLHNSVDFIATYFAQTATRVCGNREATQDCLRNCENCRNCGVFKKRQLMYDESINKNSCILSTRCRALDAEQL
jgi:hypothetical protein